LFHDQSCDKKEEENRSANSGNNMKVLRRLSSTLSSTVLALGHGIQQRKRDALAKAITLIESTREDHKEQAALLLDWLSENSAPPKATIRIGVAGPPGAGKSTFIEALGMRLVEQKNFLAVVPVDPSSHLSGGSILGDKTRMENLCRSEQAYVRASPTRGVLGGIAEHTADVISLCESSGYNVVIVESVGLGQSEVDIDSAVDMLLIIVPPGSGDSLQASKKGIVEAADLIIVNKADGNLLAAAKHTKADYAGALAFVRRKHPAWQASCLLASSRTGEGLEAVEAQIKAFFKIMRANNSLYEKRRHQSTRWMWAQLHRLLINQIEASPAVHDKAQEYARVLERSETTPRSAATKLVGIFLEEREKKKKK